MNLIYLGIGDLGLGKSRKEEYSEYKGADRFTTKVTDNDIFVNIYLRADTQKDFIERRLQKFTDLVANISSLLSYLLIILFFIVDYLNSLFIVNSVIETIYMTNKEDSLKGKWNNQGLLADSENEEWT